MDASCQFVLDEIIDEPVALESRFSRKDIGNDENAKMAFARTGRVAMSGVKFGLVDDVKPRRLQPDHELFAKSATNGHLFLSR